ncbi:hypothetical protein MD273_03660 [Marinobacter pelagius]|uniref:hypothetical protein n=1 Tax=Marinobacter sp. C7 TaxID=2951363 RepID=UPI001EEF9941|nr:hypothetical protein [Marinobacter sp. C7]MCG7198817.1 hypothetical protein [Marinobacter sp. C7]
MKFPVVTVTLVAAALAVVLWEQTREQPEPVDANRFADLATDPVDRNTAVDWVIGQIPSMCEQATGQGAGTDAHSKCVKESKPRSSSCRREVRDRFPSIIASDAVFRDLSITLMNCLVPTSGLVD